EALRGGRRERDALAPRRLPWRLTARLARARPPAPGPRLAPGRPFGASGRREAARRADAGPPSHPAATGETERPRRHHRDRGSARERAGGALTDPSARLRAR